jgi:predicted RNA-binding protein with RPS1 domain
MKTNREKNTEYNKRVQDKIRPSQPAYDFKPLEDAIRQWVTKNEQT